jgi:hypothetical protein
MSYAAANIVDFVRGFGERKRNARVNEELKNYLTNPEATVQAINEIDAPRAIAFDEKRRADEAARSNQTREKFGANLGVVARTMRGLPEDADYNEAFNGLAPVFKSQLGLGDEELEALRPIVTNREALTGLDDAAYKEVIKDRYSTTVATPGAHVIRGGEVIDEVPFAIKAETTPAGASTNIFDPNSGKFITGPQDAPTRSAPAAPGPKAKLGGSGLLPGRATGEQVEAFALSGVPGLTAT